MGIRPAVTTAFNLLQGQPAIGVELGVAYGDHAEATLQRWPGLQLVLVDNYCECPERMPDAVRRLSPYNVRWFLQDTANAAEYFRDEAVDYVYVDADHSRPGVKRDLEAWYSKVKNGGVFGGHDYANRTCLGVSEAVDDFCRSIGRGINVDPTSGDWWFVKAAA